VVPGSASLAGVAALIPGSTPWLGIASGVAAVTCAWYLRSEVTEMPFHREGHGAVHTERLGYILFALSTLRGWVRPRRKRK
jgi:hypothetical protein